MPLTSTFPLKNHLLLPISTHTYMTQSVCIFPCAAEEASTSGEPQLERRSLDPGSTPRRGGAFDDEAVSPALMRQEAEGGALLIGALLRCMAQGTTPALRIGCMVVGFFRLDVDPQRKRATACQ